jgi:hypothetical protein
MKTRVLSALFLAGLPLGAEEPVVSAEVVEITTNASGFLDNLTDAERAAAGVEKLSREQREALNKLAAKEVRLARQGDVRGFAGTFISRRSDEERIAAGLGQLTTSEKYQLDRLVARALAVLPANPPVVLTRPARESDFITYKSPWETHGFIQLEYGFGSGDREYKAGTVGVTRVNPQTGTSFSFQYTAAEGDFWWNRGACFGLGHRRP